MTKNQIVRLVHKMSNEQREHLADQIKLHVEVARFMGKPYRQDKLTVALGAIDGKISRRLR